MWELIKALGIPTVGVSAAKLLEKWFGSMDRLLLASMEELQLVPGVYLFSSLHSSLLDGLYGFFFNTCRSDPF